MNIAGFLLRPLYWLAGKIFAIWARPTIQPEAPAELLGDEALMLAHGLERPHSLTHHHRPHEH